MNSKMLGIPNIQFRNSEMQLYEHKVTTLITTSADHALTLFAWATDSSRQSCSQGFFPYVVDGPEKPKRTVPFVNP